MNTRRLPLVEKIVARLVPTEGCWEWYGQHHRDGYAVMHVGVLDGKPITKLAHRMVYEMFKGPIPTDTELDHLCRNHGCVRPSHLQAVPHRVNVLRGDSPAAAHATRTAAKCGHPFTAWNRTLGRHCLPCKHAREQRAYRERMATHAR